MIVAQPSDIEMADRIRASWVQRQSIEDAARGLIRANKAARVASNGTATPEEVYWAVLRRVRDLSLGTPDDWQAWVNRALSGAFDAYREEQERQDRAWREQLRQMRARINLRPLPEQVEARAHVSRGAAAGDGAEEESA